MEKSVSGKTHKYKQKCSLDFYYKAFEAPCHSLIVWLSLHKWKRHRMLIMWNRNNWMKNQTETSDLLNFYECECRLTNERGVREKRREKNGVTHTEGRRHTNERNETKWNYTQQQNIICTCSLDQSVVLIYIQVYFHLVFCFSSCVRFGYMWGLSVVRSRTLKKKLQHR